jgi:hypothetical protein
VDEIKKAVNEYKFDVFSSVLGDVLEIEVGEYDVYEVVKHFYINPHS